MKGFKAFEKGLVFRGKQYTENTVFEEESGIHFFENPLDALNCDSLIDDNGNLTEFAEIEALDKVETDGNVSITRRFKVGAKLSVHYLIRVSHAFLYESIKEKIMNAKTESDYALLKIGCNCSVLIGGDKFTLSGGNDSTLIGGEKSTLLSGHGSTLISKSESTLAGGHSSLLRSYYKSTLVAGKGSMLRGGTMSTLVAGGSSELTGGYKSKLIGGKHSTLMGDEESKLIGGKYSTLIGGRNSKLVSDEHSIMIGEDESVAMGKIGSLIVLIERKWQDGEYVIKSYKAEIVDGKRIKEDTPYKLENGEFVECNKTPKSEEVDKK